MGRIIKVVLYRVVLRCDPVFESGEREQTVEQTAGLLKRGYKSTGFCWWALPPPLAPRLPWLPLIQNRLFQAKQDGLKRLGGCQTRHRFYLTGGKGKNPTGPPSR